MTGLRTINDPSGLNIALVERLIGITPYEVVRLVAAHLPEINLLAPSAEDLHAIGEKLEELLLLVPELEGLREIADNLEEIINGTKPASSITYGDETLDEILARLLFQSIDVISFTATPSVAETGSAVQSVVLNWTISRSASVQKINGQQIAPSLRTFTSTVPIGINTDFVLRLEEGPSSEHVTEATTTVNFKRRRYWGTSVLTALNDAQILALASEFADNRNKSIVFDATGGKYPYYAYPAEFGVPASVKVQGTAFSDYTVLTRSFVNQYNNASQYHIIRFNGIQTGSSIEVTFA